MPTLELKPTHKVVTAYYDNLAKFAKLGIKHKTAVRSAFQELLEHCARQFDWKLVPEYAIKRKGLQESPTLRTARSPARKPPKSNRIKLNQTKSNQIKPNENTASQPAGRTCDQSPAEPGLEPW